MAGTAPDVAQRLRPGAVGKSACHDDACRTELRRDVKLQEWTVEMLHLMSRSNSASGLPANARVTITAATTRDRRVYESYANGYT